MRVVLNDVKCAVMNGKCAVLNDDRNNRHKGIYIKVIVMNRKNNSIVKPYTS